MPIGQTRTRFLPRTWPGAEAGAGSGKGHGELVKAGLGLGLGLGWNVGRWGLLGLGQPYQEKPEVRHARVDVCSREATCGARYAVRTARPRLVHVRRTYGTSALPPRRGKLLCASSTHGTKEAGTRSPYVQYGRTGAYVSARRPPDGCM